MHLNVQKIAWPQPIRLCPFTHEHTYLRSYKDQTEGSLFECSWFVTWNERYWWWSGCCLQPEFNIVPSGWFKMPRTKEGQCKRSLIPISAFKNCSCNLVPAKLFPQSRGFSQHALGWRQRERQRDCSQSITGPTHLCMKLIMIMTHECHEHTNWNLYLCTYLVVVYSTAQLYRFTLAHNRI